MNMVTKVKKVVLLGKAGEELDSFAKGLRKKFSSSDTYPVIVESYLWDFKKQVESAEKYKDQIKRVYYQDGVSKETKVMLQDDIRRLELISEFEYGKSVLEVGCSDGTVSIKIAELPQVKKVLGIDIRKSAIQDGKTLVRDLVKRGEISLDVAKKILLLPAATENLSVKHGKFDSVCAYEIFEHLAPQDMLPAFQNLYKFIKKDGNFFMSVPNRFPNQKYDRLGRSRWQWFDHRNFFSKLSLEMFLKSFFYEVKFYPLYEKESANDSIYLICECNGKKYEA